MIWGVLSTVYKQAWTSQHDNNEASLADWCGQIAGLSASDIQVGLERMKKDPSFRAFPPNSMQFRFLCSNDEEEKDSLFQELVNWGQLEQSGKSQKGLFIVRNIDYTNFKRANEQRAREMFNGAYSKLLKHLAEGKELPEFHVEIEYEAPPPMPKEKLSSFFADLMKSVDNPQGA